MKTMYLIVVVLFQISIGLSEVISDQQKEHEISKNEASLHFPNSFADFLHDEAREKRLTSQDHYRRSYHRRDPVSTAAALLHKLKNNNLPRKNDGISNGTVKYKTLEFTSDMFLDDLMKEMQNSKIVKKDHAKRVSPNTIQTNLNETENFKNFVNMFRQNMTEKFEAARFPKTNLLTLRINLLSKQNKKIWNGNQTKWDLGFLFNKTNEKSKLEQKNVIPSRINSDKNTRLKVVVKDSKKNVTKRHIDQRFEMQKFDAKEDVDVQDKQFLKDYFNTDSDLKFSDSEDYLIVSKVNKNKLGPMIFPVGPLFTLARQIDERRTNLKKRNIEPENDFDYSSPILEESENKKFTSQLRENNRRSSYNEGDDSKRKLVSQNSKNVLKKWRRITQSRQKPSEADKKKANARKQELENENTIRNNTIVNKTTQAKKTTPAPEKKRTVVFKTNRIVKKLDNVIGNNLNVSLSFAKDDANGTKPLKIYCKAETTGLINATENAAGDSKGHTFSQAPNEDQKSVICKSITSETLKPNEDIHIKNSVAGTTFITTDYEKIGQFLDGSYVPKRDELEIGTSSHSNLTTDSKQNKTISVVESHDRHANSKSQTKVNIVEGNNTRMINADALIEGSTVINATVKQKPIGITNIEKESVVHVRDPETIKDKDWAGLAKGKDVQIFSNSRKETEFEIDLRRGDFFRPRKKFVINTRTDDRRNTHRKPIPHFGAT